MNTLIGITERGDASLDYSWMPALTNKRVQGVILITKDVNEKFREIVCSLHTAGYPIIVHATCTGWGGYDMEPNVPAYRAQVNNLYKLIAQGFPFKNVVLRVDPIIATTEGIIVARRVLNYARELGLLPGFRVRISLVDEYQHVLQRVHNRGLSLGDHSRTLSEKLKLLGELTGTNPDVIFETCAEPWMKGANVVHQGCVSSTDLELMGIQVPQDALINPQGRNGCLCLNCKTELLSNRHPCTHNCAYCYWKDK